MTQKAKGPAEAATSPSRGSNNPKKDKEMNVSTTITVAGRQPEPIVDRVQRLAGELSEALTEWQGGQFAASVYPADHPAGIHFPSVGCSPESRLKHVAETYKRCATAVDPTVTEWWSVQPADDRMSVRFGLYGVRPQECGK
ncbi:hypothetical protein IB270_07675 [Ensifer sp. ENS05]|uniref:hypothetical protein n=1 Tax=Ensifer sp. ENS05 TaxID=2769277 RepID=UPI001784669B|nr:hypothetical protein [Ensifer sp. ENS05]MBD9592708.1 hypothetical protein [Ensifer sp. ENS05]